MKKYSGICMIGVAVVVLLAFQFAIAGVQGEIPITTKSDEAYRLFIQGRTMFENIRTQEARELFAKAVEKDRDFAIAHLYQAFTATSALEFQNYLQEALALAPKVSAGERMTIEATKAGADNNSVKEIQLSEELAQRFPNDKRAHYYLGAAYMGQDNDEKAIAEFNRVIGLDKDYPPVYNLLGYTYVQISDYMKAEEAFKNYIRLLPKEANPYDSLGDLYTKIGRHQDAIAEYQQAVTLNPQFGFSQRKIGDNLVFLGRYEEGRDAYRKAKAIGTTPAGRLEDANAIAYSYLYEGNHPQALVESEKIVQMAINEGLPERQASALLTSSDICIEMGSLDKAAQSITECRSVVMASKLSPATKDHLTKGALFNEARIAAKRKDFANAIAKAEEFKSRIEVTRNPKEMEDYHALLGHISFDKGDFRMAVDHLRQANLEDPYTLYLLAVSEAKAGDAAKSGELLKKAANWNESGLSYALVRSKAMMAIKGEMTE
jgi:tetratricopeptide (TPR) repeat protein